MHLILSYYPIKKPSLPVEWHQWAIEFVSNWRVKIVHSWCTDGDDWETYDSDVPKLMAFVAKYHDITPTIYESLFHARSVQHRQT